jgi:protease-4
VCSSDLKVSQERDITLKDLDKLARGRVWTGTDAFRNKLVDSVGGSNSAIARAKELAGIDVEDKFELVYYPAPKTFAEKLREVMRGGRRVSANVLSEEIGVDLNRLNMLKRLQYDAILLPFEVKH